MKIRLKTGLFLTLYFLQFPLFAQSNGDEWIKVYFNMPSDTTVKRFDVPANEPVDLIATLTNLIDAANISVDLCIYDLENMRVGDALARAKERGVRVRVVTDNFNRNDNEELDRAMWQRLADAGIYSIDDNGNVYHPDGTISENRLINAGADMHHKFAVIDYTTDGTGEAFVWAGSTNMTYTGLHNTNNTMVIKHLEIAEVFTEEFEQMWGGSDSTPNPQKSRFHKDKGNVSRNSFDVGGTRVEIYFAPIDRSRSKPSISNRIVEVIEAETDNDLKFLSFAITPSIDISQALWFASEDSSLSLQGVIDRSFYSRYKKEGEIWGSPESVTGNRMVLPAEELRKMHQKFILIDAANSDTNDVAIVITGSYNFSNNAELNNDENLFIIYSNEIANQYYQNFSGALNRARGNDEIPAPQFNENEWHPVLRVIDSRTFVIEIDPGFSYPVRLLGVDIPDMNAGSDSSNYFAAEADIFLRSLLEGRQTIVKGAGGGPPYVNNHAFYGYVDIESETSPVSLNKILLENGYGTLSDAFIQHPDSVEAFRRYMNTAKNNRRGMWLQPDMIGRKVAKVKNNSGLLVEYPINLNTADQHTLQLLPGIGAVFAQRIIDYRETTGYFSTIDELMNIRGIGENRMVILRPLVSVD